MLRLLIYHRYGEMSSFYFDYCREEFQSSSKLQKDFIKSSKKMDKAWDDWEKDFPKVSDTDMTKYPDRSTYYFSREQKHQAGAIIFGAMCLEAFIYDYAAHNFSDTYVKKYLDKLNLKAKWVIIPKLVTGKDFPTDSQAFQGLQKLIEERNKLVHHKSQPEKSDEEREERLKKLKKKSERLQKLIKERNELVNHKSQLKKSDEERLKKLKKKIYKLQQSSHIVSPYETVVEVLTELKRLDCNNENNSWWQLEEVD